MNREIKFRAWYRNRMISWNYLLVDFCSDWFNKGYKLMQYTGLKDCNHREIYESDLVRFYYKGEFVICEIVFHNGCFKLKWNDGYINSHELNSRRYNVVGNIYENNQK